MSTLVVSQPFPTPPISEADGEILRLWTRDEFHQAESLGWFYNEQVELIYGKVYKKLPMNPLHALGICASAETLTARIGPGFYLRQQLPVALATDGEPLPDLVIVPGSWRDYAQHPTQASILLLVEVSDSTLPLDRGEKASLYAEAGIADYWLLNLQNRSLEARREPIALASAPHGWTYNSLTIYIEQQTVAPLALSHAEVRVSDLLPPLAL